MTRTINAKSVMGLFFVSKKNGSPYLIGDCRRTNRMFKEPPRIDLVTGEGFSGIEIDDNSMDMTVLLASGDVDNCFHRMRLQGWLRHYFCWPPLPAATLGISKLLDVPLSPEGLGYPLP